MNWKAFYLVGVLVMALVLPFVNGKKGFEEHPAVTILGWAFFWPIPFTALLWAAFKWYKQQWGIYLAELSERRKT